MNLRKGLPLRALSDERVIVAAVLSLFLLGALVRAVRPVTDQDAYWIAAAGRLMWTTGHAPFENAFSFTDPHHPWVFHELLFGLAYGALVERWGPASLALAPVLTGGALVLVTTLHLLRTARHRATVALLLVLLLAFGAVPYFHQRPPFASLVLVAGVASLAFRPGFSWRTAVGLVLLELIWTWSHGSFPLGVVLICVSAFDPIAAGTRRARLVTAGAATAVTVLNPYGLGLHGLVERYLLGGSEVAGVIHRYIEEFQPVWRAPMPFSAFDPLALILALVLGLLALRRPSQRLRGALVVGFCLLAVYQVRHVALAVLLAVLLLAGELDARLDGLDLPLVEGSTLRRSLLRALGAGLLVSVAAWTALFVRRPREAWLGPSLGGPALPSLVASLPDGARTYAPFGPSSQVLWLGYPRGVRVFYDARNDCYGAPIAQDALKLQFDAEAQRRAPEILAGYGTEYALVDDGGPVAAALRGSGGWSEVGRGGAWVLLRAAPK